MGIHKFTKKQLEDVLFEGDCLKIMPQFPNNSIDMILCDLPYGTTQNKWDSIIPLNLLWKEYERIIKKNGVIALTSQGVFTAKLIMSNTKLFKYKLTWIKSKATNFLNAKKQPLRKSEDICIFYRNHTYQATYNPQMTLGEPYNKEKISKLAVMENLVQLKSKVTVKDIQVMLYILKLLKVKERFFIQLKNLLHLDDI